MHWHNFQVSILVHICYRKNTSYNSTEDELEVIKEVHYYVSNDPMHDTLFVQRAFILHWHHLIGRGCFPNFHLVWNDGYNGQFKSTGAWYFVA
jgi:hypothetical protein